MKISSKVLYEFYVAYLKWAETGVCDTTDFEDDPIFCGMWGLCGNCDDYATFVLDQEYDNETGCLPLTYEMGEQFVAAGLNDAYPFGMDNYYGFGEKGECHKDPNRLQWVRDRIADYKESRNGH